MDYAIGDTVVHWTHGLGKVIGIDEKRLAGVSQAYYVVEVELLKLWIPVDAANHGVLRPPMDRIEFKRLIACLQTRGEALQDNPFKRKFELRGRIQKRTPEALCYLIRDLTDRSRHHPLNQNDAAVLLRAEEYFLDEWVFSTGAERSTARVELAGILRA